MEDKICPFCNGVIPKEKIKEVESKLEAQETKLKKKIQEDYEQKFKEEEKRSKEKLIHQKQLFDEFKETLNEKHREELRRQEKQLNDLQNKKIKLKDSEILNLKEKIGTIEEDILEEKNKEINKIKQKEREEREKQKTEFELKIRQLENKNPKELGEEGQTEVLEILTKNFREDDLKETKRGKAGSDIFHKVFVKGENAGLIIYEVKNVSRWDNKHVKQTKEQKTKHSANYAMLITNILPPKEKVLCEREGILIVHPTKIGIVSRQIRDFLIEVHKIKLSGEETEEKIKILQEYLTSPDYKNSLMDLFSAIKGLNDIRFKERTIHERHWAEEEKLTNKIQEKTGKIHSKIASITEKRLENQLITIPRKKKKKSN